jgi:hypothetical protein
MYILFEYLKSSFVRRYSFRKPRILVSQSSSVPCCFSTLFNQPTIQPTNQTNNWTTSSIEQVLSWSKTSPHFMETEGSLSCSEKPATCPYPQPHNYLTWVRNMWNAAWKFGFHIRWRILAYVRLLAAQEEFGSMELVSTITYAKDTGCQYYNVG